MVESGEPAQDMGGVCNPQGQLDKYQVSPCIPERTECHLTIQGWKNHNPGRWLLYIIPARFGGTHL